MQSVRHYARYACSFGILQIGAFVRIPDIGKTCAFLGQRMFAFGMNDMVFFRCLGFRAIHDFISPVLRRKPERGFGYSSGIVRMHIPVHIMIHVIIGLARISISEQLAKTC